MALDTITSPPTQVGGAQRALALFLCLFHRHNTPFGVVGADVEPRTPDRRHHLLTAPDAEALGCPRMGGTRVGDVLCALPDPHVLRAAHVREDVHATATGRGTIDTGRRSLERIRHDTVPPARGLVGFERRKHAPGEWFLREIRGLGRGGGWPLFFGDPWLLEGLFLLIPRTERRGRLREDTAHGEGDVGGHQAEKDEALSPQLTTPGFIAQFREMGAGLGRLCARVVGIVEDQGARGDAMVPQDAPHTGHQEGVPGPLAVSTHPGQGRQRRGAAAGMFQARPAPGVGDPNGGDTKRQPGPWCGGHRVAWMMRAHGVINGFNKSAHKGCRLSHNPRRLQAIGAPQAERMCLVIFA